MSSSAKSAWLVELTVFYGVEFGRPDHTLVWKFYSAYDARRKAADLAGRGADGEDPKIRELSL